MPASSSLPLWSAGAFALALLLSPALEPHAAAAHGQESAAPKIAVVDLEVLFVRSAAGQQAQQEVKNLEDTTRQSLEQEVERGRQLEESLPGKPADEQIAIQRQLEDIERNLRRIRDDANRRAARLEQTSRQAFNESVMPVFEKIQEERGYDLILNKATGVVIFAGPAVDITEEMIERLAPN